MTNVVRSEGSCDIDPFRLMFPGNVHAGAILYYGSEAKEYLEVVMEEVVSQVA